MNEEELKLRAKFYLAPKNTSLKELKEMDKKYTSYPGLTIEQAKYTAQKLKLF
jgi:hypothetical protein